jgi:hypothetical protein
MAKQEIAATVQVEATAVARPGDTLVVALGHEASLEDIREVAGEMERRLPGVKVLVVNANALAVYRPDPDPALRAVRDPQWDTVPRG